MRFTTALMLLGVMAIPGWYAYRTVTDKRFTRIDWSLLLTEDQRREKEIEEKKRKADEASMEAERQRLQEERQNADEAAKAKEEMVKATERKNVETKFEACRAAARAAESSYQAYLAERVRYRNFTEPILQNPPPDTILVNKYLFSATFEYLYQTLLPESTVASHHQNVARVSARCSENATPGIEYVDTVTEIRTAEAERAVFDRWTNRLSESMYKIQLMITYSKDAFPQTLKGQLDERRAWELLNGK